MSENNDHGAPGRSLLAEMTEIKDQMKALKAAMVQLVELHQELAQKVEAALTKNLITDGETPAQVV